jgi:two-component system sensor histidine kinase AlgZ
LRQLPEAIARAVVFGAVVGLPLSFLFAPIDSWQYFWLDPAGWTLRASGYGVTFSVSFYVACGLPVSYLLRSNRGRSSKRPWLIMWTTAILGGTLGCITALSVFALRQGAMRPELMRLAIADGIFAAILAVVLSRWYALQAERDLADARALNVALRSQINPHFFFNTLSTIASLIRPNPEAAERTIGLLADMSRYAFSSNDGELVPLDRELDFARTYLEIERARFGDRLSWVLPDPEVVQGLRIPALTLQPLVENAVRHGIARRIDGGIIVVDVRRVDGDFELTVKGPTDTVEHTSAFDRPGHALSNVRERLRLTYGGRARLEVFSPEPDMVSAVIRVPIPP